MLHLPLFSNYIFVRIGDDGRVPVLKVPGVRSIVGCGPQPLSVPDSYIHSLREGLQQGKIEPHPYLIVGAKVRIRSGVIAGMEGALMSKRKKFWVVVALEIILRSVTVDLAIKHFLPVSRVS